MNLEAEFPVFVTRIDASVESPESTEIPVAVLTSKLQVSMTLTVISFILRMEEAASSGLVASIWTATIFPSGSTGQLSGILIPSRTSSS